MASPSLAAAYRSQRDRIPQAPYGERKTVCVTSRECTPEEELAGGGPLTAFGKACYKLDITLIRAWSPASQKPRKAKPRAVYQDQLVKELTTAGMQFARG